MKIFTLKPEQAKAMFDMLNESPDWAPIFTANHFHRGTQDWIKVDLDGSVKLIKDKALEYKGRRANFLEKNEDELQSLMDWIEGK